MCGRPITGGVFQIQGYAIVDVVTLGYLGLVILAAHAKHLRIARALVRAWCLEMVLCVHHFAGDMTENALWLGGLAA